VVFFSRVFPPNLYMHLSSPEACHMPQPFHSSLFDHPNSIW
jgi:hypothetical protein